MVDEGSLRQVDVVVHQLHLAGEVGQGTEAAAQFQDLAFSPIEIPPLVAGRKAQVPALVGGEIQFPKGGVVDRYRKHDVLLDNEGDVYEFTVMVPLDPKGAPVEQLHIEMGVPFAQQQGVVAVIRVGEEDVRIESSNSWNIRFGSETDVDLATADAGPRDKAHIGFEVVLNVKAVAVDFPQVADPPKAQLGGGIPSLESGGGSSCVVAAE